MGNTQSYTFDKISNRIFYDAKKIYEDYNDFILNDDAFRTLDRNLNGGISSGVSSSETYNSGNDKINIWYDINFVELLRGRTKLLKEWVEQFNVKKKTNNFKVSNNSAFTFSNEEQKKNFMKRRQVTDNDLSLDDLIELNKIPNDVPYSQSNKYMLKKLKELIALHGFRGNKDIIQSLINLINLPEGRCTSGLMTFLNAIKPNKQNIISKCNNDKKFSIKLYLSYKNPKHVEIYENVEEELKDKIKSEILIPIKLKIYEYMKEGDIILIKYEFIEEQNINSETFEWTIPNDFLNNYNIGDEIDFPKDKIPYEISLKIDRIWRRKFYNESKKLNKPPKIEKEYYLSFNIEENERFKEFINEIMIDFISYKDKMISEGALQHYEI
jgi:hypothetical protein